MQNLKALPMKGSIYPLLIFLSFSSGYAFARMYDGNAQDNQQSQEDILQAPYPQDTLQGSLTDEITNRNDRSIMIIFTVDEQKKIHILQVQGGYNLLTEYIKKSLEGKEVHSDNAVPGINYVMTIKFPSSV